MEETQTINEKCRDFVDSHIAKETEDEARKKLSESLEEEFEVRFLKNRAQRLNREKKGTIFLFCQYFIIFLDRLWDILQKFKYLAVTNTQCILN